MKAAAPEAQSGNGEVRSPELVKIYCDLAVRKPFNVCGGCCGCIWIMVIAAILSSSTILSEPSQEDWIVTDSDHSRNFDSLVDAENQVIGDLVVGNNAVRKKSYTVTSISFLYEFKSSTERDIYTPESVQAMCKVERILLNDAQFPSYCELKTSATAKGPMTNECVKAKAKKLKVAGCDFTGTNVLADCKDPVLTNTYQFYGDSATHQYNCALLPAATVKAKADLMYNALDTSNGRLQYGFFMDKDTMARPTRFTAKTRSTIFLGGPLPGFITENEKLSEQMKAYGDFLGKKGTKGVEDELFKYFGVKHKFGFSGYRNKMITPDGPEADKLDVRFYSFAFRENEFQRVVNGDFLMVIFSLLFVYYYMNRHTGSFFLASAGMFQIFFSLPCALFFYRTIFQITYFVQIHILAVFLVLGIGADDVFVMVDAWKQSIAAANGPYSPPRRQAGKAPLTEEQVVIYNRLLFAYNRTYQAVFNTSFTTAVAFFSTGISPCMPISSFGIYAAICIILNYIFAITLLPALLVLWHKKYEGKPHCMDPCQQIVCFCRCRQLCKKEQVENRVQVQEQGQDHKVPLFFSKLYIPCMSARWGGQPQPQLPADGGAKEGGVKVVAIGMIVVCLALFVQGTYAASLLAPPNKPEAFFPSDHMFTRTEDDLSDGFFRGSEEQYTEMKLVYGIDRIDRSGFNKWEPDENRGTAIFNTQFNIAPSAAQKALGAVCTLAQGWACSAPNGCTDGVLARPGSVICFIEQFRTWHTATYGQDSYAVGDTNPATFYSRLETFVTTRPVLDQTGAPLLTGKFTSWKELVGFINSKLVYAVVPFTSTMLTMQPLAVKNDVTKAIDALLLKLRTDHTPAGHGLESLFHTADRFWVWSATEQGLIDGMFLGLIICFPVAYLVLIGATKNLLTASYAIFAIGCIVCTVLGFCESVMQWPLGVGETIAAIIVIGFSVDYVVHLGHMVEEAALRGMHSREDRFRYAAETMGPTVLAGAITTGGSAVFMFFCQMTFFFKMAVLICITIFMSFVFSLGFFMATIYVIGPQGSTGHVPSARELCKQKQPAIDQAPAAPVTFVDNEKTLSSGSGAATKTEAGAIIDLGVLT